MKCKLMYVYGNLKERSSFNQLKKQQVEFDAGQRNQQYV